MVNKEAIERVRETYFAGMRIRLVSMNDIQAPPVGTEGTVLGVDDMGAIMVSWDTGSSLSLILEVDKFEIIK